MPSRKQKAVPKAHRPEPERRYPPRPPAEPPEVVDPRWIAKALGATLLAAFVLAYLAVCLLVYQGGWQLMLEPTNKVDATPAVPFQTIHFDAGETGTPRLTGWWIPAQSPTSTMPTILYLHGGIGSLGNSAKALSLLHRVPVNIFAIDYRGYGQSSPGHPTEARMSEDASAALEYLTGTRHIPETTIVAYGEGLGAALAANLANAQTEIQAVILDTPDPEAFSRATDAGKARLLPMRLLVQERFDVAAALAESKKPKLLLADRPDGSEMERIRANQALFRAVPDPKMTVTFDHPGEVSEDAYVRSVERFLDEYLPHR
jgi:pimeloyl-ACP methyl ester carboxylesterase